MGEGGTQRIRVADPLLLLRAADSWQMCVESPCVRLLLWCVSVCVLVCVDVGSPSERRQRVGGHGRAGRAGPGGEGGKGGRTRARGREWEWEWEWQSECHCRWE